MLDSIYSTAFVPGVHVMDAWLPMVAQLFSVPVSLAAQRYSMMVTPSMPYQLGMFIMDKLGVRFQEAPTMTIAVMSLALAILVMPRLGVVGSILSNCVGVLAFQIDPFIHYVHRNRGRLCRAT